MRLCRVLLLLAIASAAAVPVLAQSNDRERQARELFAVGKYTEALEIYGKLYAETLHPTYLRNVGRCYQNLGEPDKAISSFSEYLRQAKNLSQAQRGQVEGYIREMEELKRKRRDEAAAATAAAKAAPAEPPATDSAKLRLDAPDPAQTGGAAKTTGATGTDAAISRAGGDDDAPPVYTRWWFWTAAAVLVAGGVVGALALSAGDGTPQATTTFGTMRADPMDPGP